MEYGRNNKAMVRKRYAAENNIIIFESEVWIDLQRGFL